MFLRSLVQTSNNGDKYRNYVNPRTHITRRSVNAGAAVNITDSAWGPTKMNSRPVEARVGDGAIHMTNVELVDIEAGPYAGGQERVGVGVACTLSACYGLLFAVDIVVVLRFG